MADDEESAKKVAYNDYRKFLCVTLKGDKYNPQGTLEGGFQQKTSVLNQIQVYKEKFEKRTNLLGALEKVNSIYEKLVEIRNHLIYHIVQREVSSRKLNRRRCLNMSCRSGNNELRRTR